MQKSHKILTTERFTLEPLQEKDAPLLADLGADPDIVKNLICDWSLPERRLEIAEYWIEKNQEFGIWGVYDRDGGFGAPSSFVGFCAADEPLPLGGQGPEIYYAFKKETWGKGVASEIMRALLEHLFNDQKVKAVEALVLSGLNPASHRLLEKFGMRYVGRYPLAVYAGEESEPTIRYELWRVENASSHNDRQSLEEAAFRIGQFVADGVRSKDAATADLEKAAVTSGLAARIGAQTVKQIIEDRLEAGIADTGWLHYRVDSSAFV